MSYWYNVTMLQQGKERGREGGREGERGEGWPEGGRMGGRERERGGSSRKLHMYLQHCHDVCDNHNCTWFSLLHVHDFQIYYLFFLIEIEDLKDVIEYMCFNWTCLSSNNSVYSLALIQPILDKLTDGTKPENYETKVMTEWLNQVDKAQPTWNNLAKALDKRTVKAHVQAAQIREDLKNKNIKLDV